MPRRAFAYLSAVLFFLSMASTVATSGRAQAQAVPAVPPPAQAAPEPVRPSQTFIQIDGASLIAAAGVLATGIGAGIRSAAGVVTRYMASQAGKSEARELAQAETVKTLASIVANYHAGRQAATDALEEFAEDLEELREAVAEAAGRPKPKPRSRTRRRPPPLPSVSDDTDAPPKPVSNL